MPATLTRRSTTAAKLRAGLLIRRQIDQLERRFARTVNDVPKHMLARNIYGFSATEMRKIAQKLHAKAKAAIRTARSKEFRGSIEEAL
jgi:hypothetical protein